MAKLTVLVLICVLVTLQAPECLLRNIQYAIQRQKGYYLSELPANWFKVIAILEGNPEDLQFALQRESEPYHLVFSFKLNWFKAFEYCRSQGMFLLSIQNREKLDGIVKFIEDRGYFMAAKKLRIWTSGNDLGEEGQFYWASTGDRVVLDVWAKNEPNNAKDVNGEAENCVLLDSEANKNDKNSFQPLFNDCTCRTPEYFICEL